MKDNKITQVFAKWKSKAQAKKEANKTVCHLPEELRNDALISVRNLYKKFGKLEVLNGINLDIYKGDVVAIIGPSGCGKSTFLRCLNGLETPSAGEIILENEYVFKNERVYLKRKMRTMKENAKKTKTPYPWTSLTQLMRNISPFAKRKKPSQNTWNPPSTYTVKRWAWSSSNSIFFPI